MSGAATANPLHSMSVELHRTFKRILKKTDRKGGKFGRKTCILDDALIRLPDFPHVLGIVSRLSCGDGNKRATVCFQHCIVSNSDKLRQLQPSPSRANCPRRLLTSFS